MKSVIGTWPSRFGLAFVLSVVSVLVFASIAVTADVSSPEQMNRDAFRATAGTYAPFTETRSPEQKNRDAFREARDDFAPFTDTVSPEQKNREAFRAD